MADKYDIPALMNLALKKFKDRVQTRPEHDYIHIVSTVLDSTQCQDIGLRPAISEICLKNMDKILGIKDSSLFDVEVIFFLALFDFPVFIERSGCFASGKHSRLLLTYILSNLAMINRMSGKMFSPKTAISCTTFFVRTTIACEMFAIRWLQKRSASLRGQST